MKKLITYGTPKEYQVKPINENSNPSKITRNTAKYCKKLKGDHVYVVHKVQEFVWSPKSQRKKTVFTTYKCTGCEKNKVSHIEVMTA